MEESKSHLRADYKKKLYDALMTETKIETLPLDQTEGRKEGNQAKKLSHPEIQGQRKRSIQAPLKTPPNLKISILASLPIQGSQFKKPERPPTPDSDWNKRQHVDSRPPQTWISQVSCAKEPRTSFDELMDTSFEFSAFVLNRFNIKDMTQEILAGPAFELLKGTCKSLTELEYHLEECSKAATERLDWHNPEGKPRIVIQRRMEDLQLDVKSYQKKLNLTKPYTLRLNLRNKTTYTAYSDPKGVIYKDQMNRNRLMRADELHKFSDGTLDDVRSALNDISKGIRMEYLPKRK
ncbi:hypothetical protein Tco_0896286 [Tanacetum coccineum]